MPTITTTRKILDSSGRPFNGFAYCRVRKAFTIPTGEVTPLSYRALVTGGQLLAEDGTPFSLPPTPAGNPMQVKLVGRERVGGRSDDYSLPVRALDIPDVDSVEWLDLPYAPGFTPDTEWWDLTGLDDFPPAATVGDFGVDGATGDWFMNGA